ILDERYKSVSNLYGKLKKLQNDPDQLNRYLLTKESTTGLSILEVFAKHRSFSRAHKAFLFQKTLRTAKPEILKSLLEQLLDGGKTKQEILNNFSWLLQSFANWDNTKEEIVSRYDQARGVILELQKNTPLEIYKDLVEIYNVQSKTTDP